VVARKGYEASFRPIRRNSTDKIAISLEREVARPSERLVLMVDEEKPAGSCEPLRGALINAGFQVIGERELGEIQPEVSRAGGISHTALRAWIRARFNVDHMIHASCSGLIRNLDQQLAGQPSWGEAVQGVISANATVDLELVSLQEGTIEKSLSGTARDFSLDKDDALKKATGQASEEAASALRESWPVR
jgi:hypothetical protein